MTSTTLPSIAASIISFINGIAVPLLFALAFILFLIGIFKFYFVNGLKDPKAHADGNKFIVSGVIALAVMLSVWGLVNLVMGTLWLDNNQPRLPGFSPATSGSVPATNNSAGGNVPATNNSAGGNIPATNNSAKAQTSPATDPFQDSNPNTDPNLIIQ